MFTTIYNKTKIINVLDSPGHKDFVPNMITGASQAECAVLVINATKNEFEAGFKDDGQTQEHCVLIQALGIKQVIMAINQMDKYLEKDADGKEIWSKTRYDEIVEKMVRFLTKLGFKKKNIKIIPVSGFYGINLTEPPKKDVCPWYTGPTLIDLMDNFKVAKHDYKQPLRLCITDKFRDLALGNVITGKIDAGSIMPGDQIYILPANVITSVKK
eukprot:UN23970